MALPLDGGNADHEGPIDLIRRCTDFLFEGQQLHSPYGPQFIANPLALMIAPHFSISLTTKLWRYSGDRRWGAVTSAPSSRSRPCTAGLSIVATVASCSLLMMAVGVPLGRKKASHLSISMSFGRCA